MSPEHGQLWRAPHDLDALLTEPDKDRIVVADLPTSIIVGSQTHAHTKRIAGLLSSQGKSVQVKYLLMLAISRLLPFGKIWARGAFAHLPGRY